MSGSWTLVTGGAQGLGAAICLALARQGRSVVVHYRESAAEAERVVSECRNLGVNAESLQGDFSTVDSTQRFVEAYLARFPETSGLVNNVGVFHLNSLAATSEETWQMLFQVNVHAPRALMIALLPALRLAQGSVVNIGMAGIERFYPDIHSAAYMASKTTLWQITHSFAREVAVDRVRANMVSPGYMEQSVVSPPGNQWMPMGRMVERDEVAQIVAFLMSEGTAYVTGQNLEVAGGTRL